MTATCLVFWRQKVKCWPCCSDWPSVSGLPASLYKTRADFLGSAVLKFRVNISFVSPLLNWLGICVHSAESNEMRIISNSRRKREQPDRICELDHAESWAWLPFSCTSRSLNSSRRHGCQLDATLYVGDIWQSILGVGEAPWDYGKNEIRWRCKCKCLENMGWCTEGGICILIFISITIMVELNGVTSWLRQLGIWGPLLAIYDPLGNSPCPQGPLLGADARV